MLEAHLKPCNRGDHSSTIRLTSPATVTALTANENKNKQYHLPTPYCRLHLLSYGTMIVIPFRIVPPPSRERLRRATSAENRKGQDKQHRQTGAVESACDEVRVIPEDAWTVVS